MYIVKGKVYLLNIETFQDLSSHKPLTLKQNAFSENRKRNLKFNNKRPKDIASQSPELKLKILPALCVSSSSFIFDWCWGWLLGPCTLLGMYCTTISCVVVVIVLFYAQLVFKCLSLKYKEISQIFWIPGGEKEFWGIKDLIEKTKPLTSKEEWWCTLIKIAYGRLRKKDCESRTALTI